MILFLGCACGCEYEGLYSYEGMDDAGDAAGDIAAPDVLPEVLEDTGADVAVETERVPPDECGNGIDDNGNGVIDEACTCFAGDTQPCWPGEPSMRGIGACRDGIQQCEGVGEFLSWGACEGYVLASAERIENGIDDDCDGLIDCDDPDVSDQPRCQCVPEVCTDRLDNDCDGLIDCDDPDCDSHSTCYCNAGGSWGIHDLWYACPSGGLCSSPGSVSGCHDTWSTGGTFTARCAGRYEICARVVSNGSGCIVAERCVTVTIPSEGSTASLPDLPGWNESSACAYEAAWGGDAGGGRTCVRVTGTTSEGTAVDRDAGCFGGFIACNDPDGTGEGGTGTDGTGVW